MKQPQNTFITYTVLLTCTSSVLSWSIPPFVHLCKKHDPEIAKCFTNTIYEIMPNLVKGIPEMDIPPIDPLHIPDVNITTGNAESINLDIGLLNGTLTGFKNLELKKHVVDVDHARFSAVLFLPYVRLDARYVVKGKIWGIAIESEGLVTVNGTNATLDGEWLGSFFERKSKQHIRIDNIIFSNITVEKANVNFHDMLARQFLEEIINVAVNDNIDMLKEELDPLIKEIAGEAARHYFNRVYQRFPVEQLFPSD